VFSKKTGVLWAGQVVWDQAIPVDSVGAQVAEPLWGWKAS
jgi:hypothetical protein